MGSISLSTVRRLEDMSYACTRQPDSVLSLLELRFAEPAGHVTVTASNQYLAVRTCLPVDWHGNRRTVYVSGETVRQATETAEVECSATGLLGLTVGAAALRIDTAECRYADDNLNSHWPTCSLDRIFANTDRLVAEPVAVDMNLMALALRCAGRQIDPDEYPPLTNGPTMVQMFPRGSGHMLEARLLSPPEPTFQAIVAPVRP